MTQKPRYTDRERHRNRQTHIHTHTHREKERERERERDVANNNINNLFVSLIMLHWCLDFSSNSKYIFFKK